MSHTSTIPNEFSRALSYCEIYQRDPKAPPPDSDAVHSNEEEECFWLEDEWTEHDTAEAEQILTNALERCSITDGSEISVPSRDVIAWNRFYKHHKTHFFKDRHYLETAFPEFQQASAPRTLVEVGCGVGNAILPRLGPDWIVHGLDLSQVAIDWLQQEPRFVEAAREQRAFAHVADIAHSLPDACRGVAHVTTLLFCLSAIDPSRMAQAAQNVAASLRPNGVLLFRDYGRYDQAQLKLGVSRNKRLGDNFYRKHDGTKCFYFSLEDLKELFVVQAGLEVVELDYIRRVYRNRATKEERRRVWVQGRFRKPP